MIEKELETLKRNWFSDVDPTLEGIEQVIKGR